MVSFRRALHTIRSAMALSGARPAYAAGVRASLATVIPLAAGDILGHAGAATWMSLGGFNGALSDRGGSYRSRAGTMALLLMTASIAAILGTLAAGHFVTSLAVTFVVAFLTSVLRVWGNRGISVGLASLSTYVVALAIPTAHPAEAFVRAGYIIVGSVWAMAIALVLWPLMPYRPARLAVAKCYEVLAQYVEQVATATQSRHTSEWPVQLQAPATITSVRSALEEARAVLVQLRRGRPGAVDRGERLLVLEESADQVFGHIVALGETLATIRGRSRNERLHDRCVDILQQIARTSRAIASGVEMELGTASIPVEWGGDSLRVAMRENAPTPIDAQYEHAAVILDRIAQFASAASVAAEALNGGSGAMTHASYFVRAPAAEDVTDDTSLWDSFRTLLSPGSLILRFALRVAVVTTTAVALTDLLELKKGYWVTITALVILQPYTGVTLTRAVQRVLGTVVGGLLAVAFGAFFHDPRAILVIATVFVACCVALLPLNYAAFSVFLTPTFVLLAEASTGEWNLAGTRVANTLLGGALALLGTRLLWPSSERSRFPTYAAQALRANRAYLSTVIDLFDDHRHAAGEQIRAARRAAGLATVNAEESLQRALAEVHGDESRLAPALTFLAYTRRFTASVAALAIARYAVDGPTRKTLDPFRDAVTAAFDTLAASLEGDLAARADSIVDIPISGPSLSPLVRARVERLARQVTTIHDAVLRLAPSHGPVEATAG